MSDFECHVALDKQISESTQNCVSLLNKWSEEDEMDIRDLIRRCEGMTQEKIIINTLNLKLNQQMSQLYVNTILYFINTINKLKKINFKLDNLYKYFDSGKESATVRKILSEFPYNDYTSKDIVLEKKTENESEIKNQINSLIYNLKHSIYCPGDLQRALRSLHAKYPQNFHKNMGKGMVQLLMLITKDTPCIKRHTYSVQEIEEGKQQCGGKCEMCGSPEKLEGDHWWSLSKFGIKVIDNMVILCYNCNVTKKDCNGAKLVLKFAEKGRNVYDNYRKIETEKSGLPKEEEHSEAIEESKREEYKFLFVSKLLLNDPNISLPSLTQSAKDEMDEECLKELMKTRKRTLQSICDSKQIEYISKDTKQILSEKIISFV